MPIRDRLVVLTGASSGIGAATALAAAQRGGRMVLVGRNEARLARVAAEIASSEGHASVYPIDLGDARAVARLASDVAAREEPPDVLINNAGAGRWLTVEETSATELEAMTAVPYFAAFNLTREFLPGMRRRGSGHIVSQ